MFLPKLSLIINFKSEGKSFFASSNLFLDDHCSTSKCSACCVCEFETVFGWFCEKFEPRSRIINRLNMIVRVKVVDCC